MVLDYCYRWRYGDNDYGQPRGPGMILDLCHQVYLLTGGPTAQAHSFMYLQTGDKKYLEAALANLPQIGNFGNPWKDYALSMRNAAMCIGDLHRAARKALRQAETP